MINEYVSTYGKKYAEFLSEEKTTQEETELMAMRDDLIKRQGLELVVAIEKCCDYDNFGGSVMLKDYIAKTKWVLVDPSLDRIKEWELANPMELYARDNKHCIENLTAAMLTLYTYKYIEQLGG